MDTRFIAVEWTRVLIRVFLYLKRAGREPEGPNSPPSPLTPVLHFPGTACLTEAFRRAAQHVTQQ